MNETYSVYTEPWIPVTRGDGTCAELSLRDTLEQAHEIDEINDASPLVEYGLYRLLITFLMDALRPRTHRDIQKLLQNGKFDMGSIDSYVETCRAEGVSFDLFDPERPFLQTPYRSEWDTEKTLRAVDVLDHTLPRGSSHVHMVHPPVQPRTMTYAQAARHLPAAQLFCTAAAQGYPSSINGAPPYYILIRGSNLFSTLVASTLPTNDYHNVALDSTPVWWRNQMEIEPKKKVYETSILFGLMFPARRVLLVPDRGVVRSAYYSQGLNFVPTADMWTDPHVGYYLPKPGTGQGKSTTGTGRTSWKPKRARPIWRNIAQLVAQGSRPRIIDNYKDTIAEAGDKIDVTLYGLETDQAAYLYQIRQDLLLPQMPADQPDAIETMEQLVADCDSVANALRKSLQQGRGESLETMLQAQGTAQKGSGKMRSLPGLSASSVESCVQQFYDACEPGFWAKLDALAAALPEAYDALRLNWIEEIATLAYEIRDKTIKSVNLRAKDFALYELRGATLKRQIAGLYRNAENSAR